MAIKILFRIEVNGFSEKSSKNMKKLEIQIQRHIYVSFFHFECPWSLKLNIENTSCCLFQKTSSSHYYTVFNTPAVTSGVIH